MTRSERQRRFVKYGEQAFGFSHMKSVQQRALRFLEEAVELYQACGCPKDMAHKLVDYICARPPGLIGQELGGVGVTLLALADAAGFDADAEEEREGNRVMSKDPEHFKKRNEAKNAAGFVLT